MSTLTATSPFVNFDLPAEASETDDYRPPVGPDFVPTAAEEAEAAELRNAEDEPDWDAMAEDAYALTVISSGQAWL